MMETTNTTIVTRAAATAAPTPNYIRDFFSSREHDYPGFFSNVSEDDKTEDILKEIRKTQEKTEELQGKLQNEYAKKYARKYTPLEKKVYVAYNNRKGETYNFSVPDGQRVDLTGKDDDTYVSVSLTYKTGEVTVPCGYAYELASIIGKHFSYTINSDNSKCKLRLIEEKIYPFFDEYICYSSATKERSFIGWRGRDILTCLDANKFINTLFGTSRNLGSLDVSRIKTCYERNKSFETILKTAPDDILLNLLDREIEENKPIHKILGIEKDVYNASVAAGNIKEVNEIAWAISKPDIFHKTPLEWFNLIEKCKKYEKDLGFYDIEYSGRVGAGYWSSVSDSNKHVKLLDVLADAYAKYAELHTKYSFGKFVDYVVKQTIDQAYGSIRSYLGELVDYLRMCDQNKVNPTLFSSQLSLTHAIAQRNHKINVSFEDEEKFKSKYCTFTPYETGNYKIIAPSCSNDMKKEGDQLDHCVASYIKRVIDGECLVYFLRHKDHPDDSLITIEIEGDCIVQARGMHNKFPDEVESTILNKFAGSRGYRCSYAEVSEDDKKKEERKEEEE